MHSPTPGAPVRRLAPCPCGSGLRYKDCHGRIAAVPAEAAALNDEGLERFDERDIEGAKACFHRAIALAPAFPQAHFNLSLALLMEGDYANGWAEYAWRTRAPGYSDYANYPFGMPRWAGEPLAGKRILVHAEQGFGDTLQFARFLPRLARDGAIVDVFCQPALAPLMHAVEGVRHALGDLEQRPDHDFHAPIIDIGAHYLPSRDATHWDGPYIAADAARVAHWARELEALPRPRAGLVWKGSARFAHNRPRSLDPAQAAALAVDGISWVSLQFGEGPPPGTRMFDVGSRQLAWPETAAVVQNLDLVVSVDTAPAHLAGAMGRPVWVMRPYAPDWRWGLSAATTPWYPSMRLFWQPSRDAWDPVIETVRQALAQLRP